MTFDPFSAPEPAEIPLPRAPLIRVLAQVRFAPLLGLEERGAVGRLQEAIQGTYPILNRDRLQSVSASASGEVSVDHDTAWRFRDEASRWRVSLSSQFLAIETTAYESRSDFVDRTERVLEAVHDAVAPAIAMRVGVRYIDRIEPADRDTLTPLVRPELLMPWSSLSAESTQAILTEALFDRNAWGLRMRYGLVPAGAKIDPATIEPVDEASWLLDLDMYRADQRKFEVPSLVNDVRESAARIYTTFRWAVTDDFLRHYGGVP